MYALGESLLDRLTELHVCLGKRHQLVGIGHGLCHLGLGTDAERLSEPRVPFRDQAFVGALELLGAFATAGIRRRPAAGSRLAYTAAGTSERDGRTTRLGLGASGGSVAR